MKKLLIVAELEYDEDWIFVNYKKSNAGFIGLLTTDTLHAYSSKNGDYIGTIKVVEVKDSPATAE